MSFAQAVTSSPQFVVAQVWHSGVVGPVMLQTASHSVSHAPGVAPSPHAQTLIAFKISSEPGHRSSVLQYSNVRYSPQPTQPSVPRSQPPPPAPAVPPVEPPSLPAPPPPWLPFPPSLPDPAEPPVLSPVSVSSDEHAASARSDAPSINP